jgi:hypothetical protein
LDKKYEVLTNEFEKVKKLNSDLEKENKLLIEVKGLIRMSLSRKK